MNDLYDYLDKQLKDNQCSITATDWSAPLGLKRLQYHGGQFNGNQCKTLLANTESLKQVLCKAEAFSVGEPVLQLLTIFEKVVKSCFGSELNADFLVQIERFTDAFLALEKIETPKAHAIFVHVPQLLLRQGIFQKGLGYWSEQASETVHSDFESLWIGNSYKRAMTYKCYIIQFL